MAEALLPHTDAIQRNTLEWTAYRSGWLVRWKDAAGVVKKITTNDWHEADRTFEQYLKEMKASVERSSN